MAQESWTLDAAHSSVSFWVRHLMLSKVHGRFAAFTGSFTFDEQAVAASRATVEIDVASIDTREPQRDGHLRSPDFFDAEKYPKIVFASTKVEPEGTGQFKLIGDLTMHGVTKPVTLEVEYVGRTKHPQMGERIGFSARGTLNRKDWDITFNQVLDTGGVALGEKIELQLEIEATLAG